MNLNDAIDKAIMEMPDDFTIKEEIIKHQAEVKNMLFAEFSFEEEIKRLQNQNRNIGLEEGRKLGLKEGFEKARSYFKSILLEKGADKEIIDLFNNNLFDIDGSK